MSDQKNQTSITVANEVAIKNEDIVQVVVSEAEEGLHNRVGQLRSELAANEKALAEARSRIVKTCDALARTVLTAAAEEMAAAIEKFSGQTGTIACRAANGQMFAQMSKPADLLDDHGEAIKLTFKATVTSHDGDCTAVRVDKVDVPESVGTELGNIESLLQESEQITRESMQVKDRLRDLPRFERKVKAQLAKNAMEQTEQGKLIVDQIRKGSIDQGLQKMLAIGSN